MKSTNRYYTEDRAARFRSGQKELILRKNDLFRLELFEGRPSVIKDGVVYFVNERLVKELKKRSEIASVQKLFKSRDEFFNLHGIDIEKAAVKNLSAAASLFEGTEVRHNFINHAVYFAFNTYYDQLPESVTVVYELNSNSISLGVYCHSISPSGWSALPKLRAQLIKFQSYLTSKYGLRFDKLKYSSATYGNIKVVERPFTGRVHKFSANWYL